MSSNTYSICSFETGKIIADLTEEQFCETPFIFNTENPLAETEKTQYRKFMEKHKGADIESEWVCFEGYENSFDFLIQKPSMPCK